MMSDYNTKNLILKLDDAVKVLLREDIIKPEDEEYVTIELMQKCYRSTEEYDMGYQAAKEDLKLFLGLTSLEYNR